MHELREKALALPLKPGVYIMMDKSGEVIYVGKAKQLKNRVGSYFHGEHDPKTAMMVSKIESFDVIVTNSEFEALVLENALIKRHMPRYNILLKDGKGYPFIRVDTREAYPRFSIVSERAKDGAKYFGPYGGRNVTRSALEVVRKALGLPGCNRSFPRDIGKERPCLNHHMGACLAFCQKPAGQGEYKSLIDAAVMILEGKTRELTESLTAEMEVAAADLQFERAAQLRDRIKAVGLLDTRQRVISGAMADTDAVGFYRGEAKTGFVVLHYIGGHLLDKDFMLLENPLECDDEAVSALVRQYYMNRESYPKTLCLPCEVSDQESLAALFSEKAGKKVQILSPKRGERLALIQTANLNAREEAVRATTKEERTVKSLDWLREMLELDGLPHRIEAYDISNTGSSDIVASMTVFVNGKPAKKAYRRFKIKGLSNQDDYQSMAQVLTRRFTRLSEGDEAFGAAPDLVLIDGGANHAAVAEGALRELGLSFPVFGMAKDDRHRTRVLQTSDGREIGIAAKPAVFALIGSIQEETHRFAISYHRQLRSKNSYGSSLDKITGVGPSRRNALLRHFKSIEAIKGADISALRQAVPADTAAAVYGYFHQGSEEE